MSLGCLLGCFDVPRDCAPISAVLRIRLYTKLPKTEQFTGQKLRKVGVSYVGKWIATVLPFNIINRHNR